MFTDCPLKSVWNSQSGTMENPLDVNCSVDTRGVNLVHMLGVVKTAPNQGDRCHDSEICSSCKMHPQQNPTSTSTTRTDSQNAQNIELEHLGSQISSLGFTVSAPFSRTVVLIVIESPTDPLLDFNHGSWGMRSNSSSWHVGYFQPTSYCQISIPSFFANDMSLVMREKDDMKAVLTLTTELG